MAERHPHICVCIPTFRRPAGLQRALRGLEGQAGREYTYSLVVVDNDCDRSALPVVRSWQAGCPVPLVYDVEPVQNIALARNRALRHARGDYAAFMDDDECPAPGWLRNLLLTCRKYRADGVLGPVEPDFPPQAPSWLTRSSLCYRPSYATGTRLHHLQTRTGNVLFRTGILAGLAEPFPAEMGRTGGEDIEFFRRMTARGHVFIWCAEAPVYESIAPERLKRGYYLSRAARIGGLTGEAQREGRGKWAYLLRSAGAATLYACLAFPGLLRGQHRFMERMVKLVYHLARIAGCFGYVPVREI